MTLLSRLFKKFPKVQEKVGKIPGSEKYVNEEGLVVPQNFGAFLIEVATEFYKGIGTLDGQSEVTATLEFDEQQRISNILNPTVNGTLKVVPFQTVEKISDMMSSKLRNAPTKYKVRSLSVQIKNGDVNTNAQYYA
jgi:hypothetical protein